MCLSVCLRSVSAYDILLLLFVGDASEFLELEEEAQPQGQQWLQAIVIPS